MVAPRPRSPHVVKADLCAPTAAYGVCKRREERAVDAAADASKKHDDGTPKPGGLGQDGTIPAEPDGVAAGHTGDASTFEPEEDGDA